MENKQLNSQAQVARTTKKFNQEAINIFREDHMDGYLRSFAQVAMFPMFLIEPKFAKKITDGNHIHTLVDGNCEVVFRAAPVQNSDGSYDYFFPSSSSSRVFKSILEMISNQLISLVPVDDGGIIIEFMKKDVRDYMASKGRSINGTMLNTQLQILMNASVSVKIVDESRKLERMKNLSYLLEADMVTDKINTNHSFVRARIHPMIAADLRKGLYKHMNE
ncbi:hypothetical protein [Vibrio litoralis]|uniref:hypothetical protein n=1 Tax=Vibrio litoralis TaxID=335972 RepID=UPI001865C94E|nr:hypothetical protein [Vibrio litoralis]